MEAFYKSIRLRVFIENNTNVTVSGKLTINAKSWNSDFIHVVKEKGLAFSFSESKKVIETEYVIGEKILLWDEFSPALYNLCIEMKAEAERIF